MRQRLAKREVEPAAAVPVVKTAANTVEATAMRSEPELRELIAQAAYYRAEKRGFRPGLEADDWLQAEAEVMARVQAMRGRP